MSADEFVARTRTLHTVTRRGLPPRISWRHGSLLRPFVVPHHGGPVDRERRGPRPSWGLGYAPADMTASTGGRKGTLLVDCWCGHSVVRVPEDWPSLGRTGSCSWKHCDPEHALTRIRRSYRSRKKDG